MKDTFRQSMTWLHTWAGLVFCWILYFMFITGTLGYFDTEIDRWMQPELRTVENATLAQSIDTARARLESEAPGAERWLISPPGNRETPQLNIFWQQPRTEAGAGERGEQMLDVHSGEPLAARETAGGQTLYRMHYLLHYLPRDVGYRIVGVITLLMFVGLITGIVIHKNIFKDFFTFRPGRRKRSWLDIHNLLSVATLPFQLMITYSGLVFVITLWMPLVGFSSYGFDAGKLRAALTEIAGQVQVEPAGTPAPLGSLTAMADTAVAHWGDSIRSIEVKWPGDANARVIIRKSPQSISRFREQLVFDGVSGELLQAKTAETNAPQAVANSLIGLHEGLFAGPLLRWLYFISGLLGAGMVATGAIYWVVKRRPKPGREAVASAGHRLVECLNVGTIAGLPVAIAAYFWANRLLPVDMAGRADWEVHVLFMVWLAALIHPRLRSLRTAWIEQLWLGAAAFTLLPLVNAATTDGHLLQSLAAGDWLFAGFDLTALATGLLLGIAAWQLGRHWQPGPKPEPVVLPAATLATRRDITR